jgi:hypothetical protein
MQALEQESSIGHVRVTTREHVVAPSLDDTDPEKQ